MSTQVTHFSDSEDEAEDEQSHEQFISAEEYEERITKHQEEIATLTQELASLKTSTAAEVQKIEAKHAGVQEIFNIERTHHAEELLKRQSRIDFLMDKMISK